VQYRTFIVAVFLSFYVNNVWYVGYVYEYIIPYVTTNISYCKQTQHIKHSYTTS